MQPSGSCTHWDRPIRSIYSRCKWENRLSKTTGIATSLKVVGYTVHEAHLVDKTLTLPRDDEAYARRDQTRGRGRRHDSGDVHSVLCGGRACHAALKIRRANTVARIGFAAFRRAERCLHTGSLAIRCGAR